MQVARMERSEMREWLAGWEKTPDCASLHPGYARSRRGLSLFFRKALRAGLLRLLRFPRFRLRLVAPLQRLFIRLVLRRCRARPCVCPSGKDVFRPVAAGTSSEHGCKNQ